MIYVKDKYGHELNVKNIKGNLFFNWHHNRQDKWFLFRPKIIDLPQMPTMGHYTNTTNQIQYVK